MASTRTFPLFSNPLSAILFAAILICQWHHLPENAGELLTPPILSASGKKVSQNGIMSPAKHVNRKVSAGASSNQGATGFANNKGDVDALTDQFSKMPPKEQEKKEKNSFTCKDENGQEVAWFIAIKEARSWSYIFATSNNPTFQRGADIRTNGPVNETLLQTSEFPQNTDIKMHAYTSFRSGRRGHQNGVFLFGRQKGFWLIHSWRRLFSHFKESFQNVNVGSSNGQSFICTTHKRDDLEDILYQLKISRPNPETGFENNLGVAAKNSNIAKFTLSGHARMQHKVVHFSKWETENRSIYTMIADKYGIDGHNYKLSVQSWQKPRSNYPIDGRIDLIGEHKYPHLDTRMDQNTDHSKWCVPVRNGGGGENYPDSLKFVCIGDLNMHKRGGGAMCLFNDAITEAFRMIAEPGNDSCRIF